MTTQLSPVKTRIGTSSKVMKAQTSPATFKKVHHQDYENPNEPSYT
ncbi:hypothetical protein [Halalkalibacter alkaliphilus]|uniref:Uncharacterized protein n=1 Tax=Halalkalibacter alkaliphilus TaxID=2917993 RepID=A0A9X2CVD2_9BACI|nr:hypothetical protein [Halalkalibacter alkaliphilus]MCL7748938.1 hypothetical protein [Halalkalibacter alkaliphilus]